MEGPTKILGPPVCPLPGQELLKLGGQLRFVPLPNATLFTSLPLGLVTPSPAALGNAKRIRRGKTQRK